MRGVVGLELIGGQAPTLSLQPWDTESAADYGGNPNAARAVMQRSFDLLHNARALAVRLTELLVERGSSLRVELVPRWYFADGIYPTSVAYLGLIDPVAGTRRLFLMGPHNPGIIWVAEETEGPAFEYRRRMYEGTARQAELRTGAEDDAAAYLAPFAVRLKAHVAGLDLTEQQRGDIAAVGDFDTMGLADLAFVCRVIGLRLEALLMDELPE